MRGVKINDSRPSKSTEVIDLTASPPPEEQPQSEPAASNTEIVSRKRRLEKSRYRDAGNGTIKKLKSTPQVTTVGGPSSRKSSDSHTDGDPSNSPARIKTPRYSMGIGKPLSTPVKLHSANVGATNSVGSSKLKNASTRQHERGPGIVRDIYPATRPRYLRLHDEFIGAVSDASTADATSDSSSSSSYEHLEVPDTAGLLSSFQHSGQIEGRSPRKSRLGLNANVTDMLRTTDRGKAMTQESFKSGSLAVLEQHSMISNKTSSNRQIPASVANDKPTRSGQDQPSRRSLHNFEPEMNLRTPSALGNPDRVYNTLSPHQAQKMASSPKPTNLNYRGLEPSHSAKKASDAREEQATLVPVNSPKFSDFPDKESNAFKSFLERRKRVKNNKEASRKGQPFDTDETDLLNYLKGECDLTWSVIAEHFPGRSKETLQTHWCTKLARNHPNARRRRPRRDPFKHIEVALRSSRQKRPTKYVFDPLSDEDLEQSRTSTPNEGPSKDGSTHTDRDDDDDALQPFISTRRDRSTRDKSSQSEQTGSIDSLLGSSETESDQSSHRAPVALPKRRGTSTDNSFTIPKDTNKHNSILAIDTKDPLFTVLKQTQYQINQETERRRLIPRRRGSNRPLYLRQKASSLEFSDPLQAGRESQLQNQLLATRLGISGSSVRLPRRVLPYLSFTETSALMNGSVEAKWDKYETGRWRGAAIHVDFTDSELLEVRSCVNAATDINLPKEIPLNEQLRDAGRQLSKGDIARIVAHAARRSALRRRTGSSIESFLADLSLGTVAKLPIKKYIGPPVPPSSISNGMSNALSLLQDREIGDSVLRARRTRRNVQSSLRTRMLDTLGPLYSFKGTSGDVHTVAWAPNSSMFAIGSVATTDQSSMQYNRPKNLLLGDTERGVLRELPDHAMDRPRPETGINASEAMRVTQDPLLYMTVSQVGFSLDGNLMFSAGYDNCVRVWNVASGLDRATLITRLSHKAPVDVMAIGGHGVLATGSQRTNKSIKIVGYGSGDLGKRISRGSFTSERADNKAEREIYPSCLKWGIHGAHSKFLLAGFASNTADGKYSAYGETCLWNAETGQQLSFIKNTPAVFDCAWNPIPSRRASFFAVGSAAPLQGVNRGTHSVVRFYDPATPTWDRYRCTNEFECPAYDMNDIIWCPHDENLIGASCTNGKTYLWDIRKGDLLSTLKHGRSLMPLDESQPPELVDTGVRFSSWGPCRDRFYTGSSDGLVSAWNPYVAPDDMHVRDVVQLDSGVMCGAFSPDYTNLLLGEEQGSVNLLSVGHEDRAVRNLASFKVERAPLVSSQDSLESSLTPATAAELATELVEAGAIALRPMGSFPIRQAVQGPNYEESGLKDTADDAIILRAKAREFQVNLITAETRKRPCNLHNRDNLFRSAEEEREDSKRSMDRIPEALRQASKQPALSQTELRSGATAAVKPCSNCGRATRPRIDPELDDNVLFCEICSFTCIRCSSHAVVLPGIDAVECRSCGVRWRADILGYSALQEHGERKVGSVHANKGTRVDAGVGRIEEEPVDGLLDYYHSLWENRPESPM